MREVQPRLGTYIPIFAEVTETITGNKANGSGNSKIYTFPEKMSFSQTSRSLNIVRLPESNKITTHI
jgi:hypothetical protein